MSDANWKCMCLGWLHAVSHISPPSELSRPQSHVRGWLKNGNNQGSEKCFLHTRRLTQNGAATHTKCETRDAATILAAGYLSRQVLVSRRPRRRRHILENIRVKTHVPNIDSRSLCCLTVHPSCKAPGPVHAAVQPAPSSGLPQDIFVGFCPDQALPPLVNTESESNQNTLRVSG
jgi:hypothetical protein